MKLFKKYCSFHGYGLMFIGCGHGGSKEQRHGVIIGQRLVSRGFQLRGNWSKKTSMLPSLRWRPYGGTGLTSEGALCIIGTPEQEQGGDPDDPRMAYADFMTAGRDEQGPGPNAEWVNYYVKESRREIYDWLTGFGVRFEKKVILMPDNTVPRWHKVVGKGRGLLEPIYRDCGKNGKVKFYYRFKAVSLLRDKSRIEASAR